MTSAQKRILLWAVPRSVSSAMCRAMMNSGLKTQVIFEPYSMSYYFGPERISDRYSDMEINPDYSMEKCKMRMEMPYEDKELVFAKDMPYYLSETMSEEWIPQGYLHAFIIRHPRNTVASYYKVIDKQIAGWGDFDPKELGFKEQLEMFHMIQKQGHKAIILDADDLTENPEGLMRAFCQEVGLEFQSSMLNWAPMSEEEYMENFGAWWEDDWFSDMKTASGLSKRPRNNRAKLDAFFSKYDQQTRDFIESTVAENVKYYEEMRSLRLVVDEEDEDDDKQRELLQQGATIQV